jgi:photosystem II stability/assembly factor-like uncharacterized protein
MWRRAATRAVVELLEDRFLLSFDPWRELGPAPIQAGHGSGPNTGRIVAVAAHPTNANIIYIAAASGGVWKTTDGGQNWLPLTDNLPITPNMGAIAVAKSNPNVVYAGTGEATWGQSKKARGRDNIYYGRGVLVSTNGGSSWALRGTAQFDRRSISQIVVHPTDPAIAYLTVGTTAQNGLPGNKGVYRTTDFGANWAAVFPTNDVAASDIVMDPTNPDILYAAIGANEGNVLNGVFKSTDGGDTWAHAGNFPNGLFDVNVGRIKLAIAKTDPDVVYASIVTSGQGAQMSGHLYKMMKTTDGGVTWTQIPNVPDYMNGSGGFGEGDYDSTLIVDPNNANIAFAAGSQATAVTSFIRINNTTVTDIDSAADGSHPHPDHHGIAFDASGRLLDTNDGGIWRLDNPNLNFRWVNLNGNLNTVQFTGIALHPTDPNIMFGGTQDNGTLRFTGSDAWEFVVSGDGGYVRVDPSSPNFVYTEMFGISLLRSDTGGTPSSSYFVKTFGINGNDPKAFYVQYIVDRARPNRLLFPTDRVYESNDRGDSWTILSTPGSGGWTATEPIDAIAAAASDVKTIYATAGGHIFVTFNHGSSWHQRDIPGFTDHFADIQVDPSDDKIAYAVRDRFGGQIFRTADGGMSWTNITSDMPETPAYSLRLSDERPNPSQVLYLGTDNGIYYSANAGGRWDRSTMPFVQVHELEYNSKSGLLAAGTNGRGVWGLDLENLQINGTSGDDVIRLVRGSGASFEVNVFINGVSTAPRPYIPTVRSLTVNGLDGNDKLVLDFTNGNFLPPEGLFYNGGSQSSSPGDSLEAIGNSSLSGSYIPDGTVHGNGTVIIGGRTVVFTGLEPVTVSGFADFTLVTPNSDDSLLISADASGNTIISGTSGGVAFESLTVDPATTLILDTTTNNAPGASDTISFGGGAGLAGDNILVVTATGTDSGTMQLDSGPIIAFSGLQSFAFAAGDGDDLLIIHNPADSLFAPVNGINYDGGGQAGDALTLDGGGGEDFSETYSVGPGNGEGKIAFTGPVAMNLTFTGLAPVTDTVTAGSLTVNATAAANTILLDDGPLLGDGLARVSVDLFEPIHFANKAILIVNALAGADTVKVLTTETPTGLTGLALRGDDDDDTITVDAGVLINVTALGGSGNDRITGGGGDDELIGGLGADTASGGEGRDALLGDQGMVEWELLDGSTARVISIPSGKLSATIDAAGTLKRRVTLVDPLIGSNDVLIGGGGDDVAHGGAGADAIWGDGTVASVTDGGDALFGDDGDDALRGGGGDDHLYGGEDGDLLDGGTGADIAFGGSGNDALVADQSLDRLIDWTGNSNTFASPGPGKGAAVIIRAPSTHVRDFLLNLATADGAEDPAEELSLI